MSLTEAFPSADLAHKPTPLERLHNLSVDLGIDLWIKRDDCTGLAFGGNKTRQLEFYIGQALAEGADTLLTTGAVQSNHVRQTVAAARKLGLDVEVQLEERVEDHDPAYHHSGNPFLVRLMGAMIHHYPVGEDEEGADKAMYDRAETLRAAGKKPYVIPLSNAHLPWGALGYVDSAEELYHQLCERSLKATGFVVPSGSASTHAGFLTGMRALGETAPIYGLCVRRPSAAQRERVWIKSLATAELLGYPNLLSQDDVKCDDSMLAPGYGQMSPQVEHALKHMARREGILLDPTYTAKSFAGLLKMVDTGKIVPGSTVIYLHTGGAPALFGYPELVSQGD